MCDTVQCRHAAAVMYSPNLDTFKGSGALGVGKESSTIFFTSATTFGQMGVARPATTTSAMSALEATTPSQIAGGKAARALPAFQTTCHDAPRKLAPSMVARFAVMALMVAVGYPQKSVRDRLDITPLHRHAPHTGMHTRARSHSFSLSLSLS